MFLFATCWWNSPNQNQPNPKQSQNQTKNQTLQTKPHKHDPTNQTLETTQHNPKLIKTHQNFWKKQTQPKQHDQIQNQNNAKQPKTCLKTTQNHPTPGAKPHQNHKTCQNWKKKTECACERFLCENTAYATLSSKIGKLTSKTKEFALKNGHILPYLHCHQGTPTAQSQSCPSKITKKQHLKLVSLEFFL